MTQISGSRPWKRGLQGWKFSQILYKFCNRKACSTCLTCQSAPCLWEALTALIPVFFGNLVILTNSRHAEIFYFTKLPEFLGCAPKRNPCTGSLSSSGTTLDKQLLITPANIPTEDKISYKRVHIFLFVRRQRKKNASNYQKAEQ